MKIKQVVFGISAMVLMVATVSCSKDKKLEKTLYKKDGNWTIKAVTWNQVVQSDTGQSITSGTTNDAGTFSFSESGSGDYNFTVDGLTHNQTFNWSVSDESISIAKVSQSFDFSGNVKQIVLAFSGTQSSKDHISFSGTETVQAVSDSLTQTVFTGDFSLEKN